MSLVSQLKTLATRVGTEIKGLVRPDHPGLARAWVNFGYVGSAIQISSSQTWPASRDWPQADIE